uniref:Uncharacterized protein n=1 Tax=Rhizophora mucronata TaxID=61149 RepID=A0A2P2P7C9_RHIMU
MGFLFLGVFVDQGRGDYRDVGGVLVFNSVALEFIYRLGLDVFDFFSLHLKCYGIMLTA